MAGLSNGIFSVGKNLAFGVGIGIGVALVIKRILQDQGRETLKVLASLEHLTKEVEHLKSILLQAIGDELFVQSAGRNSNVIEKKTSAAVSSDDDDEFFDTERGTLSKATSLNSLGALSAKSSGYEDAEEFFQKIDVLQSGSDAEKVDAHNRLRFRNSMTPGNCNILWRLAKAEFQLAGIKGSQGDLEGKKSCIKCGIDFAADALKVDYSNDKAHRWYAVLIGSYSDFQVTKDRILSGYKYKEHIEKAIALNPSDPYSLSLLGRWCFEVYMLPWYMRKAAATLFAEPPTATVDEALDFFLKAEELQPGFWLENTLFIGKCYYQKWDYANAKIWLGKTVDALATSPDDIKAQNEARDLMARC